MSQRPTETPPAESSTKMVRSKHANDANAGPVLGNRTPMVAFLMGLAVIVLLMAGVILFALSRLG